MNDCIMCPECEGRSDDPVYCVSGSYLMCEMCHEDCGCTEDDDE